jgi:hypothetical protein
MKKLLVLTLTLTMTSLCSFASSAPAKASALSSAPVAANASEPQIKIKIGNNRRRGYATRVVTRTRVVHVGRRTFRETYRIKYLPGGGTKTTVVSRERIS